MIEKTFLTDSADQAMMIFGAYDANLSLIEDRFKVKVFNRDGVVVISGDEAGVSAAYDALSYLKKLALLGEELSRATELIREHVSAVDALADALLERNHLRGDEIERILGEHAPRA